MEEEIEKNNEEQQENEENEEENKSKTKNIINININNPLTGVRSRSREIESLLISSLSNYSSKNNYNDKFSVLFPGYTPIRPTKDNSSKKCVYMYEDRYTFSRILPSNSLIFNSHFESGNLHSAHLIIINSNYTGKTNHTFYDLYMHEDINSLTGTAQWFYFSVSGMREKQTVSYLFIY